MMNKKIPENQMQIDQSLQQLSGRIYRHGPKGVSLVCEATRLGNGMWLSVRDRGTYGGKVYGEHQGELVLVDLWLHPEGDGPPMPIQWSSLLALNPIMAFYVPQDVKAPEQPVASLADVFVRDYTKFYRLGATGETYEGCNYDMPMNFRYDVDREYATAIAARGDMGYGMPLTACGGPVVDDRGVLLGVIVGKDWGVDSSHAGFYVPVEMLQPSLKLLQRKVLRWKARESEWRLGFDRVSHRSNDVYFD